MANEKPFLDIPGLTHLWAELKKKFAPITHNHQFVMTLTYDSEGINPTADKTWEEFQEAVLAGMEIRIVDTSGMEYELVAFAPNYMAYFVHQLADDRHIIGFRANNTMMYTSDTPFTTSNPPTAAQVGAKGSNNASYTSGSIKTWAKAQKTSTSIGVYNRVTDMPETGGYWVADLTVSTNGLWRKLTVTRVYTDGAAPTTYECTCSEDTWSAWQKVYSAGNPPTAAEVGARPNTWMPTASDVGAVPTSRTVNGKALSSNITLSASDVGARPNTWVPNAYEVGARPNTWMPTASDIGAAAAGYTVDTSVSGLTLVKSNGIVHAYSHTGYIIVYETIPVGYRPANQVNFVGWFIDKDYNSYQTTIRIRSNGVMDENHTGQWQSNQWVRFQGSWQV